MKHLVIYLSAMLLLSPCISAEDSQILIVLKHCTSSGNKKFVDKITTPRKPINRTTSLTSIDIYFRPTVVLDAPIYLYYNAYKKFATQYKPFMVNLKIEFCDFMKVRNHPGIKAFFKKINESQANFLDPCPIKGHRYIKPYYTSYEHFPPLLPIGMWRIEQIITKDFDGKEEEIFRTTDYYEITPKGIEEF